MILGFTRTNSGGRYNPPFRRQRHGRTACGSPAGPVRPPVPPRRTGLSPVRAQRRTKPPRVHAHLRSPGRVVGHLTQALDQVHPVLQNSLCLRGDAATPRQNRPGRGKLRPGPVDRRARLAQHAGRIGPLLLQQAVGENDLDNRGDRLLPPPVALQFTGERDPADRLAAGLDHPFEASAVGLG
jgi:hypothetical protein